MSLLPTLMMLVTAHAAPGPSFEYVTLKFKPAVQARIIDAYGDPLVLIVAPGARDGRRVVRKMIESLTAGGRPFVRFGRARLRTNVDGCAASLTEPYPPAHVDDLLARLNDPALPDDLTVFLDGLSTMDPALDSTQLSTLALTINAQRRHRRVFVLMTEKAYRADPPRGLQTYGVR